MNIIKQNKKRQLVEEYGPYMNKRYAIYDTMGVMEVWFSDKQKALSHWEKYKNAETWAEKRERYKQELLATIERGGPELDELPFI